MCNSKRDPETGIVTVTVPCSWASRGHRLYPLGGVPESELSLADERLFADFQARRALVESTNGRPHWGAGMVEVDLPEAEFALELQRYIELGLIPAEEPQSVDSAV